MDNGRIKGSICATTVTTIYYIAAKDFGRSRAREQVHGLLGLFEVAPVDRDVLDAALDIDFSDYEDAVLHEAARAVGAITIVTEIVATSPTPRFRHSIRRSCWPRSRRRGSRSQAPRPCIVRVAGG